MEENKNKNENTLQDSQQKSRFSRRQVLKSLLTLPVFGVFSFELLRKQFSTQGKRNEILTELGLDKKPKQAPAVISSSVGEHIRIGIIGVGSRGESLLRALGFAHPEWVEKSKKSEDGAFNEWFNQSDLNISITGICEVFNPRAEHALAAAQNDYGPGGISRTLPKVKRFLTYQELLASNEIDGVIIATPDHHHARMTIDAVKAGKHVYCEKCLTRTADEAFEVERVVKNSNIVFQLGHQYSKNETFLWAKEVLDKNILGKISIIETTTNRNTPHGAWIRHIEKKGTKRKPGELKDIDWEQWLGTAPYAPFSIERYYNWAIWWEYSTGLIGQLFSHEFDAVNQLLNIGIPRSVVSSGGLYHYKDGRETPDVYQAVFEYPERELSLLYSASLMNSRQRGRVFMGSDASMELGQSVQVTADQDSKRYKDQISKGLIDPAMPLFNYQPQGDGVDGITSATSKYYENRGLIYTVKDGKRINITHLHLKEWLDVIRNGGELSCGIDKAFEEAITCHMATQSYRENRRVEWDPVKRQII